MSLRLRLLAGLGGLVATGLVVFGMATYLSLQHVLLGRLDQQLTTAAATIANTSNLNGGHDRHGPPDHGGRGGSDDAPVDAGQVRAAVGPDLFVQMFSADGRLLNTIASVPASAVGTPQMPSVRSVSSSGEVGATTRTATVARVGGGDPERVAVTTTAGGSVVIVVAGSLHPVTQTLHRLLAIELAAGGLVLLVTLTLGMALAGQATRPLEAIAVAADAIAAGDLSRRVDAGGDHSEVARVGAAFNSMLAAIEESFGRRDAIEGRLRRFVADASHELATPLTSIRGYAELFHRGLADRPEDLAKAMDRIEREGARMGGLVDDLLLLASLDSGRPVRHDPVDLRRIALDTAVDIRVTDPDRAVTCEADAAVIVLGDEDRLRQVAANLASNARRHTPAGTPITIRARRDGHFGVLEIADRGPGLSPEAAGRVFDRFYRHDTSRSRQEGGTGLGLSIVATIAEVLGGQASVTTAEGYGATFSIAIPLAGAYARVGAITTRL